MQNDFSLVQKIEKEKNGTDEMNSEQDFIV